MLRAVSVSRSGSWSGTAADRVELDHDARHRRRIAMEGEGGLAFLLDLPQTERLRDGDGLVLEDGRIVEVRARPEPLLEVRGRDPRHLLTLAWHLGNRHLAAQIEADCILLRRDPVIADMLRGLGAELAEVEAAFDPEPGAYGHSHGPHG
jgi:urease accessory protein